jgi:hypothetical protein
VRKASANIALSQPPAIVYAGLDENGTLTAESPFFVTAAILTPEPLDMRHLIPQAVTRSGKRLGRLAKDAIRRSLRQSIALPMANSAPKFMEDPACVSRPSRDARVENPVQAWVRTRDCAGS